MPSRMIHYAVAMQVSRSLDILDGRFLLGSIAPDAHDGTREGNHIAHFRIIDRTCTNEYLDISGFERKYMNVGADLFLLGYWCHLITDNHWLKEIYLRFAHGMTKEQKKFLSKTCYRDYSILNRILIKQYRLPEMILQVADALPIEEISSTKLEVITAEFAKDFRQESETIKPRLLKEQMVFGIIDDIIEECLKKIINSGFY